MNATNFMDKQIMELSGSSQPAGELFDLINPQKDCQINSDSEGGTTGELFDLINPQKDRQINSASEGGTIKNEEPQRESEVLPSYDFHPIQAAGSSSLPTRVGGGLSGSWPPWDSIDSKMVSSNLKNAGILEPRELTKVRHEKEKGTYDTVVIADIDSTVKKYADNLMNAMEEISSRLSKLESRTQHLENSVDELKLVIGNNNGSIDGRLRQIDNILKEVHSVVQTVQNKQNIMEAQLHLAQSRSFTGEPQQPTNCRTVQSDSVQLDIAPRQQPVQHPYQHPAPQGQTAMLPVLPMPNAPQPTPQQNQPPKLPPQIPQSQIPSVPSLPREPYFSGSQHTEAPNQQYQVHMQQAEAITSSQPPHYHPPQLPQYSQLAQSQLATPSPQLPPAVSQQPEEPLPYLPAPQSYLPNIHQPASFPQPLNGPSQQFYNPNSNMYEPPASKMSSELPPFSTGFGPTVASNYSDSFAYSGLPPSQSSSASKPLMLASPIPSGGSSKYPRLPTAQILPQAASPTSSASGASSGTRVPIDDVVEKVATMGFSKEQVRATVRKLTENGQSVDLNVVLDKLMNDGEIQPQKGWFGR